MSETENSNNTTLRPLADKLIVQLIKKDTVSAGGIILTRADETEATRGKVLAVGPDVLDIQLGDVILPNWNKARKTSDNGQDVYIVQEDDIVAVFVE